MKKYRPYCAGFIVLYVLAALCFADVIYQIVGQFTGNLNEFMQSMSLFTYLLAALAIMYVKMYAVARIEISSETMKIVCPVYIRPQAGAKRASFIYRQGDTDLKLMNKTFRLEDLEKYGWIEDLGYSRLDASQVGEKNKLFPVHEIALVMKDGKRYHMNAAFYNEKQLRDMMTTLKNNSGVEPSGKLAEMVK